MLIEEPRTPTFVRSSIGPLLCLPSQQVRIGAHIVPKRDESAMNDCGILVYMLSTRGSIPRLEAGGHILLVGGADSALTQPHSALTQPLSLSQENIRVAKCLA